ncbi:DUF2207 family protein [Streptococcus fryi]
MKKVLYVLCFLLIMCHSKVSADDVTYDIVSYQGDLTLHTDNTATFKQTVVYDFDTNYNGQYVTLGKAGKMPEGFDIIGEPTVVTYHNDVWFDNQAILEPLSDGYRLKIYNAGKSGDRVKIEVTWQLDKLLFVHQDVAELKWIPISDWDQEIKTVDFRIRTDRAALDHKLFAHLGYFRPETKVVEKAGDYFVAAHAVDAQLELRGYWDRAILDSSPTSSDEAKASILKEEAAIKKYHVRLGILYQKVLPVVTIVFTTIGSLIFLRRSRLVKPPKITERLYQAPEDLPPLLVAKMVYGASLEDTKNEMSFDHMIQASLLDLMDRGHLELSKDGKRFKVNQEKSPTSLDQSLLCLLFGESQELAVDELFGHYYIDKSIYKKNGLTSSEYEKQVRQQGRQLSLQMKEHLSAVDEEVRTEIIRLGQKESFRPLNRKERTGLKLGLLWLGVPILLGIIAVFVALGSGWSTIAVLYGLFPCIIAGPVMVYLLLSYRLRINNGTLTQEGLDCYRAWQSYSNMFKDIDSFNRVDVESLVVWNQVLVYAALFGEAKRVQDYLRVNHISLANPALDTYVGERLYTPISHSLYNYHNYSSTAAQASHFSVSSTGSVGGGFSGGGGGGGGGAF